MKNKFTITEGEVQRILGLHKQAILKENGKNILNEDNCKNKNPYNALTDGGLNWKKERQKWVDANCKGTTPCILGNSKTNNNLKNAFCDKTWPTDQNNSNKYTFDFDAVMKAIDDTGKCSNIISDVNKVFKQTKQENFLILSDNFTPEKSDLITPEGTKWKTNARLSKDDKRAYTIVGSDDDSLLLSDGLLFTCDPTLANNVTYSFFYMKTKKLYSNEELGSILKNQFCDGKINQDQNVKDEPIGDKVKSGLNNVVNPINTTISKDKYYEYISN